VELAGGDYPEQVLEGPKSPHLSSAPDVTFVAAPGASVAIGRLEIRVPHVEFRSVEISEFNARYNVDQSDRYAAGDLTFREVATRHFSLNAVQNVRVVGAAVGPNRHGDGEWAGQDGVYVGAYPPDKHPPSNLLFERVHVSNVRKSAPEAHSDCMQFTAGVNVTIRNSRFQDCEHADLMIKGDQGPIDGFLIENNFLDETLSAHYSINLYETSRGCRDVAMRHNTALQNIRTDACSGGSLTSTIQPSMASHVCSGATVEIAWNVYQSGQVCGPNDRVARVPFANEGAFDLRLVAGSPAIGRGMPGNTPADDINGQRRDAAPDAGADEHR
jgi:hypothetical protein